MNDIPRRRSRSVRKPLPAPVDPNLAGIDHTENAPPPVMARRSSTPSSITEEFLDPDTGLPLRRRSKKDGSDNVFDVAVSLRKAGWDYQWFTMKVMGEAVDASVHVDIADGAWRAVTPKEMPGYMPAGYDGATIDRKGQRLYKRPQHITTEAQQEGRQKAQQQKADKFRQAQMTDPAGGGNLAPRSNTSVSLDYQPLPTAPGELVEV